MFLESVPLTVRPALTLACGAVFLLAILLPSVAGAAIQSDVPSKTLRLHADRVAFYYDRFLVEGDGNVQVTSNDGSVVTGDVFSMDLKLNRYVVAGHVHVQSPGGSHDGAALANFLDVNRIYFVPLTGEPDRWTFVDGDYSHPLKGRQMPADTFALPELGNARPFLEASQASIAAHSFVRFGGSRVELLNGLGGYVPVPSFYLNFSSDQHLAQNSLSGANFDATYEFAGDAHSISALHFRYDTLNKTYLAFEQHLSSRKSYVVFSANPLTRPSKFFNLLLSQQPSSSVQIRSFTQLHTYQYGLSEPFEAQQTTDLQVTGALKRSFATVDYQTTNFSLLTPNGRGYFGPASDAHGYVLNHPQSLQLAVTTFDNKVFRNFPLMFHTNYGAGFYHDALGVAGGQPTLYRHFASVTGYLPSFKIGSSPVETRNVYLSSVFTRGWQWDSIPHATRTSDFTNSLSKFFNRRTNGFVQYEVFNAVDDYGAAQNLTYPGTPLTFGGTTYPGYAAFRGTATFRTLSLGLNYNNGNNFSFSVVARKHTDFPNPIPGYLTFQPAILLGSSFYPNSFGQPPYDITGDVRFRINPHMAIDIQRAYYFNFGNLGWNPQFLIQITQ